MTLISEDACWTVTSLPESAEDAEVGVRSFQPGVISRNDDIGREEGAEIRGQHSDDGVGHAIQVQAATDYATIGIEFSLPVAIGQNHEVVRRSCFVQAERYGQARA